MNHIGKEHIQSMSNVFGEMLDCGLFSDVTIIVGTKRLKCHKIILSASSRYFYNMFSLPMKERNQSEINLPGFDEDLIEDLLKYLYTGHIKLTIENVKLVLHIADMMCLDDLKNVCCDFLTLLVDASNCLELWILANKINTDDLLEESWKHCLQNFEAVVNSDSFPSLPLDLVIKYISHKELNIITEEQAVKAVLKWASCDNQIFLRQALDAVRLEYLSPAFIKMVLLEHPVVKSQAETTNYIHSVLDHMTLNTSAPESLPTFEHRLCTDHWPSLFILGGLSDQSSAESHGNCSEIMKIKVALLCGVDYNGIVERNRKVPTKLKDSMKSISCCSLKNIVYMTGIHNFEKQLWQYNVTSNSWSFTDSFAVSRSGHNLICGYSDFVYALCGSGVTGIDDTAFIECVMTTRIYHEVVGKLLYCVYNAASVFCDGKIYVFGGFDVGGKGTERMLNKIQMFDTVEKETSLLDISIPLPTDVLICRTSAVQHRGYIIVMVDYGQFWVTKFRCLMKANEISDCSVGNSTKGEPLEENRPCGCCKFINLPLDVNEDICNIEVLDDMFVVVTGDFEYTTGKIYKTHIQDFLSGSEDLKWAKHLRFKEPLRPYQICKVSF